MTAVHRRAARVVCLDADGRILLMCWHDPVDAHVVWEPPGGGVEPGETDLAAARRELAEETGLDPAAVHGPSVTVQRDFRWNGRHFTGPEEFFLARLDTTQPALSRTGLMPDEQEILAGHAWVSTTELAGLAGLDPPELADIIQRLATAPTAD